MTDLQKFVANLTRNVGISDDFMEAANHTYSCTCKMCYSYHKQVGPEPDTNIYGPFGESLFNSYEEWLEVNTNV